MDQARYGLGLPSRAAQTLSGLAYVRVLPTTHHSLTPHDSQAKLLVVRMRQGQAEELPDPDDDSVVSWR